MKVESPGQGQDSTSPALLSYGMTSGMLGEGEGASVGETELSVWLEHVWFKHVPQSNFLLADSFPVHTAQKTQKLLLEVSHKPAGSLSRLVAASWHITSTFLGHLVLIGTA